MWQISDGRSDGMTFLKLGYRRLWLPSLSLLCFESLALAEASCHVRRTLRQPICLAIWWEKGLWQTTKEKLRHAKNMWINLEVNSAIPGKPWEDHSPGQCTVSKCIRTLTQNHPEKPPPDFWLSKTLIIPDTMKVCCLKLLNVGVVGYIALNN